MKFRLSRKSFIVFSFSDILTLTLCLPDRKIKRKLQRVSCSSLVIHKYIDKRTISHDETQNECETVIDTKHNKCNFDRLNFIEFRVGENQVAEKNCCNAASS